MTTTHASRTMLDKLWASHIVQSEPDGDLLYIDMHLTHEVTTPQPFERLRTQHRPVRQRALTLATADHDVPTDTSLEPAADTLSGRQLFLQRQNCADFGVPLFPMGDPHQGIVHVVGPELGLTLPGMTIVCGDSHTSTHGAFGALAFGIGTSQVEHVLATQCLRVQKPKALYVHIEGQTTPEAGAKDVALAFLAEFGTDIGTGYAIEFGGPAVAALSMEGRMTLCNMAIEAGARTGMVAPDAETARWLNATAGLSESQLRSLQSDWEQLRSDAGAEFDRTLSLNVDGLRPVVTWGITPAQSVQVGDPVPEFTGKEPYDLDSYTRALTYTGLTPGQSLSEVPVQTVFIGSCTNGRIEDLREAAAMLAGNKVAEGVRVLVVPGSATVARQAESEGLAAVFVDAGCEWRAPGCSMCIAMNDDRAPSNTHVASTSNRNFVNRQGPGAKTHLMSPRSAAQCAITGHVHGTVISPSRKQERHGTR